MGHAQAAVSSHKAYMYGLQGRPICGGVSKAENVNACLIVAKDEKNKIEKIFALTGSPEKDGNAPWYHHFLHAVCNTCISTCRKLAKDKANRINKQYDYISLE